MKAIENIETGAETSETAGTCAGHTETKPLHLEFTGPDYVNVEVAEEQSPSPPPLLPQKQRQQQPPLSSLASPSLPLKHGVGLGHTQTNGLKPLIPPKPKNVSPSTRKVSTATQVTLVKKSSFRSQNPSVNSDSDTKPITETQDEPTREICQATPTTATSPASARAIFHKSEDEILSCIPKESVLSLKEKFESPQNSSFKKTIIEEHEKIYIKKIKVKKSIQTIIKPKPIIAPKPKPILKNKNASGGNTVTFAADCEFNRLSDSHTQAKRILVSKNGIVRSNSLPANSACRKDPKYVSNKGTRRLPQNKDRVKNRRNACVYNNTTNNLLTETNNNNNSDGICSLWNWNSGHEIETEDPSSETELLHRPLGAIVFSGWKKSKTFPVIINRRPPTIVTLPTENRPFNYLKPNPDFLSIKALKNHQVNSQHPNTTSGSPALLATSPKVKPKIATEPESTRIKSPTTETENNKNADGPIAPPRQRRKSLIFFPPNFNIFNFNNNAKTKTKEVQDEIENKNPDAILKVKQVAKNIREKITEPKKAKPKAPDPPSLCIFQQLQTETATSTPTLSPTSPEADTDSSASHEHRPKQIQSLIPPKSPHIYAKVNHNRKTSPSKRKFIKNSTRNKNDNIEKTSLLAEPCNLISFEDDLDDPVDFHVKTLSLPLTLSLPQLNHYEIDNNNEIEEEKLIKNFTNNKLKLNSICENEYEIIDDFQPQSLTNVPEPVPIMDGLKKSGCFESTFKAQYLSNLKESNSNVNPSQITDPNKKNHKTHTAIVMSTMSLALQAPIIPEIQNNEMEKEEKSKLKVGEISPRLPRNKSFLFTSMKTPTVDTNVNPFFSTLESATVQQITEESSDNSGEKDDVDINSKIEDVPSSSSKQEVKGTTTISGTVANNTESTHDIPTTQKTDIEASRNNETVSENRHIALIIPTINPIINPMHTNTITVNHENVNDNTEIPEVPKVLISDCDAETPTKIPHPEFEFEEISLVSEMTSILDRKMSHDHSHQEINSPEKIIADLDKQTSQSLAKIAENDDLGVTQPESVQEDADKDASGSGTGAGTEGDEEVKALSTASKEKRNTGLLDLVDNEIKKVQSLLAEFCPNSSSTASASTTALTAKPPETPKTKTKTKANKTKSLGLDIQKSALLRKSSVPEIFLAAGSIALSSAMCSGEKSDTDEQKKQFRRSWANKSTSSVGSTSSSSSTGSKSNNNNNDKNSLEPTSCSGSSKSLSLLGHLTGSSKSLSLSGHGLSGSTQNLNRSSHGRRRLSDISQFFWVDEGETSTGAIGDNEHSPQHSSNEDEMGSLESSPSVRSVFRRRKTVAHFFDKARKPSIASWWRPNHNQNQNQGDSKTNNGRGRKTSLFYDVDTISVGSGSTDGGTGRRLSSEEEAENDQLEEIENQRRAEAELLNKIMENLSPTAKKAFYVVREILTSEKTFVDVLRLLTIDFPKSLKKSSKKLKVSESAIISQQDLDYILGGLPILKGVNEDLLHDLEERISKWEEGSKISDIFVKKGAFLKHYTYYIKDFEKISRFFDTRCASNANFALAVKDFELKRKCHNLGLKPFMLKPVQRMPQYSLLLEDYLKYLDEDHLDYEDTVKAIGIVRAVAEHANEAIRNQMTWERLVSLQHRLPGIDILGEDKQLVKDGELMKVCRKELQPRYFALMNDCLLCMAYQSSSSKDLKVKYKLPLTRMKVILNPNGEHQFEFSIIGVARSFIVVAKTAKEREEWIDALKRTVNEHMRRRPSFLPCVDTAEKNYMLGKQAPVWVQDSRTSMCQVCAYEFSLVFRRHHCRSCGKVVCKLCSANEAPLKYLDNEAARVCDSCYDVLLNECEEEQMNKEETAEIPQNRLKFKKFNLNTTPTSKRNASAKPLSKKTIKLPLKSQINKGSDAVTKCKGYLQWKEKRVWRRNWFVLIDCILYVFAASEDVAAVQTIPVLGYTVEKGGEEDGADEDLSFKLKHKGRGVTLFQAETSLLARKWMKALGEATILKDS